MLPVQTVPINTSQIWIERKFQSVTKWLHGLILLLFLPQCHICTLYIALCTSSALALVFPHPGCGAVLHDLLLFYPLKNHSLLIINAF